MNLSVLLLLLGSSSAFVPSHSSPARPLTKILAENNDSRRNFLLTTGSIMTAAALGSPAPALSDDGKMPMVLTSEFETILRDSARSIQRVEFRGSRGEEVTVKLVDGTTFGVSDVIESPTDPRSPLKLAAVCRQYNVPTAFLQYQAALSSTVNEGSKKKKLYMNSIVQKAAEKEVLKRERMQQDEDERLADIYKMEVAEDARRAAQ